MRHFFTAAAQRALTEAAAWSLGEFSDTLEAPALLLGLLTESECRAAIVLGRHGIDEAAVRGRWPSLTRLPNRFAAWDLAATTPTASAGGMPVRHFAPEVWRSLNVIARRMRNCGLTGELEMGTEHLLLGLAIPQHEVSEWLRCLGVDVDALEAEVCRLHGLLPAVPVTACLPPLPLESSEEDEDALEPVSSLRWGSLRLTHPTAATDPVFDTQGAGVAGGTSRERMRLLRIIDAAANRAREGLRVVEDYVRFVLDDPFLTGELKGLRHDLTGLVEQFPMGERLAARETLSDVGTQLATPAELHRRDAANVVAANFGRLQESLRSLEEFTKVLRPASAAVLEQLRYRTYTLQRAIETMRAGIERLGAARICVLLDGRSSEEEFCALARSLVSAGVSVIQLRDKRLDDGTLLERARRLREITSARDVVFIVNDRPDVAALSEADGVHVGQEDLSVKDARAIVGPRAIVGVSIHAIEQARQAVLDGANYIGVGPTFPSATKHFEHFPGLELLQAVAAEIRLPAFAIGGIRLDNLPAVVEAGIPRVAVGAAIAADKEPASAARAFIERLMGR